MTTVTTGTVDQSIRLFAFDTDGAAVTGLTHASTGIAVSVVVRSKGRIVSTTALTLVARSSPGVHTDSAFTEVGSGEYVVDLPDSYQATADRTINATFAATAITGNAYSEALEIRDAPATASAQSTILNRLGGWTGSGINTILGAFRAFAAKASGLTPTDLSSGTTFDNTTDSVEAIRDRGDTSWTTGSGSGSGSGARTVTVTVNDGTTALQNAIVRMTEGVNTQTTLTNASGIATFNLDDATYTVSITKAGYSFAGTTLVVNGTEAETYSMTAIVVSPPADPALCAVTIPIVNQFGEALPDEVVEIRFNEFAVGADTTAIVLSPPPTLTSNADGLIEINLLREGKYSVFYGQDNYKRRLDFTVPDAGTFTVGE